MTNDKRAVLGAVSAAGRYDRFGATGQQ